MGGMRSREILAHWLLCVAINSTENQELEFSSDPVGGDVIGGLSLRHESLGLGPAECPEDALICVRRVSITSEDRLILIRSRENRQQLGKR
jgi:hypothetical protein